MNNSNRTVISRRSRPAKEPLSRELIVQTALDLLNTEGSSGLSMRKIAKALDTGPSSLYVYVKNHQELSAYVLDNGLGNVVLPDAGDGSWRTRLFGALSAYLKVLSESPGLAELALATIPVGPHSLAVTEYILGCLHEAGIRSTAAAWGIDLLMLYVTSLAYEQASRERHGASLQALTASYEALDAGRYPLLAGLRSDMTSGEMTAGGHERFTWGLEAILQGIMQKRE